MNFEDLQKAWQSQDSRAKITINADQLLKEVRRNQQHFQNTVFWRDVREVGVCLLMAVGFLVWGIVSHSWSLYLLAFCSLEVGIFFLADRVMQARRQPAKNDTLQGCVEKSLRQLDHQIWLLKNIFWWYLLPIIIGVSAVAGTTVWNSRGDLTNMLVLAAVFFFTYALTFGAVYYANQHAVRTSLEPRRKELEELLGSFSKIS